MSNAYKPKVSGIELKKQFGQHFLKDDFYVDQMLDAIKLDKDSSVFEIGPGQGFLTKSILEKDIARLWIFEIDPEWVNYLNENFKDSRLTIFGEDILRVDFAMFNEHKPWTLLANLPYQITFPLFYKLIEHRNILKEAVLMIQEEVAQKIVQIYGRGYGYNSLYLQHFFEFKLLDKVPPTAFNPPPKIYSRLIYFKPKEHLEKINNEQEFWKFIKVVFSQPRRNLKNNLKSSHYDLSGIDEKTLNLRAQQLNMQDLIILWNNINRQKILT